MVVKCEEKNNFVERFPTYKGALALASAGLPVVQLKPRDKVPMVNDWQHCATTDPELVKALWSTCLDANVGVQLGRGDTPIIDIECDTPEASAEYEALWDGQPPAVPTYKGKRGCHHLFHWRDGFPDKAAFHAGAVEVRTGNGGKGAQSVFPPSIHPSGIEYAWLEGLSLDDVELGTLPDAIVDRLVKVSDRAKTTTTPAPEDDFPVELEERVRQAKHWLSKIDGLQSGMGLGCDGKVSRMAIDLIHGFALPEETAVELLTRWGEKSDQIDAAGMPDPWTEKEMVRKVAWAGEQIYDGRYGDRVRGSGHDLDAAVEAIIKPAPVGPQPSRRKRAFTIGELSALPKRQWHVKGLFPERSNVILWGESGSGKTFLALDWSLCTATGKEWLGHEVKRGSVVYIVAEGKEGFQKRCQRWLEYHEMPEPSNFWVVPEAFQLVQNDSFLELAKIIKELGEQHALIVIDTLNRNIGGNENDGNDMCAFTRAAEVLQQSFGATVLIIHHTGWETARERGHSALRCNADTMISAKKVGERLTDGIECRCVKQKDYDEFTPFGVECQQVCGPNPDDDEQSSIVLTALIDCEGMREERQQERQDERIAAVIKNLPDNASAPMPLSTLVKTCGLPKTTCHRAVGDGINAKYVVRVGVKQPSYYLTEAGRKMIAKQTNLAYGIA